MTNPAMQVSTDPTPYRRFREAVRRTHAVRIALYGAGKHTRRLLAARKMDPQPSCVIACILDDQPGTESMDGIPVIPPARLNEFAFDALVISSDTIEQTLFDKAVMWKLAVPVLRLYDGPTGYKSQALANLVRDIQNLPGNWHGAGTMQSPVLEAMGTYAESMEVTRTVETGAGKTTLLFSHMSPHHTVFAVDGGGSLSAVRSSSLFKPGSTTFVEGPTQLTLPQHRFEGLIDIALIDGPHGYPFPEMEYYYLYQHIRHGGLLLVDDIHIPTIQHLFNFLCEDEMFRLEEIVLTTAFFRRTDAPSFSPTGDGWWLQGYNRNHFPIEQHPELAKLLGRWVSP